MAKRRKMAPAKSKRHFTKHAQKVHKKNVPSRIVMRGGIRM